MSDNKKYQGNSGFGSSREEKTGTGSKRVRTSEKGAKESRGFSSSKYDKGGASSRRFRGDEQGTKESREDKGRVGNKRNKQSEENAPENKKFARERTEISPKNSNVNKEVETKIIREDLVEGRNAVIEALKSDRTIEYILIAKGDMVGSISVVLALAKEKGIVTKEVDRRKLDEISQTSSHQGVIAIVTPYKYFQLNDIFEYARERGEKPFIIILDEIEDPHNFGSIIRTAEVCGAHGIIIPKRKNVGVTPTVYKTSAGAIEHMKIVKVTNINATIEEIKGLGVWVYGADMDAENYVFNTDLTGAVALVIGSEGRGISKLTKEKCDVLVKIPMAGKITSLNASVAGGIIMYEIMKQKIK
ncbi:23S rRNA (guanosine(2251)-2'-O)-methyltransferase RlmB [Clostridium sp. CM028]|nr:23S rRNA (guanosine(2251)-2'-O)-methyltransferase RlmB [Clostridium sp. CF011]MBW9145074.1 23S rRNA (guanosine(2251)-2'-O)-methyltransferase RlmB [Clostridium sp. CM027]MBW9148314.1 23S rRNA (guanosine(2251)-2'-O)-methyltransferase RlmB [Clostridium sp. CM028]MBU3091341.1 23S rRNA (guanosine(2251)-2'-O)-methyltransferase RlmB [Clostridium sp. CF011]UVE40211.1 23S rRNA (guanosine(2251)-2'-O)-methyltransferase RlmB [Clostridium sp. CM027]WLC60890.1 23S rRNA (guanosine(2251)-2'-O)-methyltransf